MEWGVQSGSWVLCREEKNYIYLFQMHENAKIERDTERFEQWVAKCKCGYSL